MAVAAICLTVPIGAQAAPEGSTLLVSRPAGLGPLASGLVNDSASQSVTANGMGLATNVSQDGRYIGFTSRSDGMSSEDDDRFENVYVADTLSGTVTLVSRASGHTGAPALGNSEDPSLSADGSKVAFTTTAALNPADTNGRADVYVRDLASGVTTLVSRADGADGAVGDGVSEFASISAAGDVVAFESTSTNLGDGDTNSIDDVHVRHLSAGHTELASRQDGAGGAVANASSTQPALSGDGTKVAFRTAATNLDAANDANGVSDIYRRDLAADATLLVSRGDGPGTPAGNGASGAPAIDADGSHVAFETRASNLHPDDPNTRTDIHLRAIGPDTTRPVSRADGPGGAIGSDWSEGPAISDDGDTVAFTTAAPNLGDGDSDSDTDVHVRRIGAGKTLLVSRQAGASGAAGDGWSQFAAVSGDGSLVAFETYADNLSPLDDDDFEQVYARDFDADEALIHVSRPSGAGGGVVGGVNNSVTPSSSADGRYVAFSSSSDALFASGHQQVFVKDTATGAVTLVSRASGPDGAAANAWAERPQISADGSRVIFVSRATNLVAGATSGSGQAYVRDLETNTTELVSRAPDGSIRANAGVYHVALSGDGQVAAFTTGQPLVPDDTGPDTDVYVRDLETGKVDLANRADGAAGAEGNAGSWQPSLDHDGDRVAFIGYASNLGNGDTDGDDDVHVRDLSEARTLYASRADGVDGAEADDISYDPSISADGTRVAFGSVATNLGDGDTDNGGDTHVRDLAAGRTLLGGADAAGQPTTGNSDHSPQITADGRRVIFGTTDALDPADGNALIDIYQRDLASGAVWLISRGDGAGSAASGAATVYRGVAPDADGSCVAFGSRAANLVPDGYVTSDFTQIYLRAVSGPCGYEAGGSGGGTGSSAGTSGPSTGGATPTDTTAPLVSRFAASPTRFRVARRATPLVARASRTAAGTTMRYRLSESARVTFTVERLLPGRRVGGRCVKPAPRLRARPSCIRRALAGRLVRAARTGANTLRFSGRIGRRALPAGRYRVTLTATDAAGNRSRPARLRLGIVR